MIKDIKDNSPNEAVVKALRGLLADAEKGELRTIFYVCGWEQDGVSTGWQRDERTTANRFIGGLVRGVMDFITATNLADTGSSSYQATSNIAHDEIFS